ncbi:uncharacterized protein LOC130731181 [Lotus japonicus]|uniref:uncharacterized protein LOC130731181 n=1 Tax=Lotus japonicus TaxID=34305 RepID=UPI0025830296|nr:uncharacterized protein LOC130731181 [Lotus japonicus]XP_057439374.1 uncharacterized protein LOC130731181 [Lotus japonicus]
MKRASNSPPKSPDINNIVGDPEKNPRVGAEYQVEVPSMITELERLQLQRNPADSEAVQDRSLSFAFGLPISVSWIHNEVEDSEDEGRGYHEDTDGTADAIKPENAANVKKNGVSDDGEELKPMTGDNKLDQPGRRNIFVIAPCSFSNSWSDTDVKRFLLGLFIFRKNFNQIKRFLENKGMGEILSFYYGKFYKSDEYRRWSRCRKAKGRKCMTGQKLFTGLRQQELLSRLIPHVSEESRETLLEVSMSYVEGKTSLEEYVSYLKSLVGLDVLVEAIGIGKEKEDLTRLPAESVKKNKVLPTPICKAWSSLEPSEIIKILTGGSRLSKAKSNDLFWEAVWPRLLARGWHSEQPKNQGYVGSKGCLVFLIPGVKKFSRRKLVKGDHYFDSVSDVLSKVGAEPNLLELEEAKAGSCIDEEPEKGSSEDDQSDFHRQCYLKPRGSTSDEDHMKFTVIDTSLAHGGKSSDIRAWKSVPINSVSKIDVDAAGDSIDKNLTMSTVIDTSLLYEGKLLKKVRVLRNPPVESDNAFKMTGLSRKSKGSSPSDDSPSVFKARMSNTDSRKGVSYGDSSNRKEAYDNPDNGANRMVKSQQNQKNSVSEDNQLKRTIKHRFSRRAISGHSNQAALPTKRRRLTACVKAEASRVADNSSGGLGSTKPAFSLSSSFLDAKILDPVSHQGNGNLIASSADKSVEDYHEESILNDNPKCKSTSCVKKCESQMPVTFNIPHDPYKNSEMAMDEEDGQCLKENDPFSDTQEVVEEPLRTFCDVDSVEQQPNANPRRQSTRNRPLTVRALESIANEFLHVQRRRKRKDIQTLKDPSFSPCRRARSRRDCSDHGTAVSAEEKHLNGDSGVFAKCLQASTSN